MEIKGGLIHSSTEHVPSVNTALDPGNRAVHDVSVYVLGGGAALLCIHCSSSDKQMRTLPVASPNSVCSARLSSLSLMFFLD